MFKSPATNFWIAATMLFISLNTISTQEYDSLYQNKIKECTTDSRFFASSIGNIIDHPSSIPGKTKLKD